MSGATRVIDAHAHFWDVERLTYPWIENGSPFDKTFSLEAYQQATRKAPIEKMVFVECDAAADCSVREAEWVEGLSKRDGRIQGIVPRVPLTDGGDVKAKIEVMASKPLVKGVRDNIQGHDPGFALQDAFVSGVRLVGRMGLHFELCLTHGQMGEALELVELCPDVSFVLDHCGKPGIRAALREPWAAHVRKMAAFPNVVCKVSGLLTEADWEQWTPDEILWYARYAVDAFGSDRVLFGSDWPVNEVCGGFDKWYAVTEALTAAWTASDRDRFYYSNAKRVYRL